MHGDFLCVLVRFNRRVSIVARQWHSKQHRTLLHSPPTQWFCIHFSIPWIVPFRLNRRFQKCFLCAPHLLISAFEFAQSIHFKWHTKSVVGYTNLWKFIINIDLKHFQYAFYFKRLRNDGINVARLDDKKLATQMKTNAALAPNSEKWNANNISSELFLKLEIAVVVVWFFFISFSVRALGHTTD